MVSEKNSKRAAESEGTQSSPQPKKRRKTGRIIDYMKPVPHSHSVPLEELRRSSNNGKLKPSEESVEVESLDIDSKATTPTAAQPLESRQPTCGKIQFEELFNPTWDKDTTEANKDRPSEHLSTLAVTESYGDIFDAPKGALIIHACNCQGSWGAGIAAAFKNHYMGAYKAYAAHCKRYGNKLLGSAQLISPQKLDKKHHFVGCLYTSRFYGKRKDPPGKILGVTAPAMQNLLEQVNAWNAKHDEEEKVREVRICMINSGLFAVPWEKTRAALEKIDVSGLDTKVIKVVSKDE